MIAAIETHYKGYRFRSRLEARWAVFFDAMGIEWQYELEGYNIDGVYYLPDFYLPKIQCYAEVKPTGLSDEEIDKVNALVLESGKKCILLVDVPQEIRYIVAESHSVIEEFGSYVELKRAMDDPENYIILSNDQQRCLFYSENGTHLLFAASASKSRIESFKNAIDAARSARFEYGEAVHA